MRLVLDQYAPAKYVHMPTLHGARILWYGGEPTPTSARSADYGRNDFFVFPFWPEPDGTTIGLFPLGGSEESLSTPFIGQWKMRDRSLSSRGYFDGGLIALQAPEVPADYIAEIVVTGGFPATPRNVEALTRQAVQMFLIKAHQFIASRDRRAADSFVDNHPWEGDPGLLQRILDDVDAWDWSFTPYIQDLPWRVRGILLEHLSSATPTPPVWLEMER